MRVMARSTRKVVVLTAAPGTGVDARIWEATTEAGVKCHLYVTRVAVAEGEDQEEFQRELQQQDVPSAAVEAIPYRLVL